MLAVITVDSLEDNLLDDGSITLREAIIAANSDAVADPIEGIQSGSGPDTIQFDPTLFANPRSLLLTLGEMEITEGLTILGPGMNSLTIDARSESRIFNVSATTGDYTFTRMTLMNGALFGDSIAVNDHTFDGAAIRSLSEGKLTIQRMKVQDSKVTGEFTNGGGIFSLGQAIIEDSTISGNSASLYGGGIAGVVVTITDSTLSDNSTGSRGGGVFASHVSTITDSVISGNLAGNGGGVGGRNTTISVSSILENTASVSGGGLSISIGVADIIDSTIAGNRAGTNGGGVSASESVLTRSTVSGNIAARDGGGVSGFKTELYQSTISDNSASRDGGGIRANFVTLTHSTVASNKAENNGGGVHVETPLDSVTFSNSIVASNKADGEGDDLKVSSVQTSYSLIGNGSGVTFVNLGGNQIGSNFSPIDPRLGPLADHGGPTSTRALLPGSPALDRGDPNLVSPPAFDQRGAPFDRIVDGGGSSIEVIDVGAFESQGVPLLFPQGDFNQNGATDAADYVLWLNTLGKNVPHGTGADGNLNGRVDQLDYYFWYANVGDATITLAGGASVQSSPSDVDEPVLSSRDAAFVAIADGGNSASSPLVNDTPLLLGTADESSEGLESPLLAVLHASHEVEKTEMIELQMQSSSEEQPSGREELNLALSEWL